MFRNQENPLIRLIRVLTMWRIRRCETSKHHRTRATVKVYIIVATRVSGCGSDCS